MDHFIMTVLALAFVPTVIVSCSTRLGMLEKVAWLVSCLLPLIMVFLQEYNKQFVRCMVFVSSRLKRLRRRLYTLLRDYRYAPYVKMIADILKMAALAEGSLLTFWLGLAQPNVTWIEFFVFFFPSITFTILPVLFEFETKNVPRACVIKLVTVRRSCDSTTHQKVTVTEKCWFQ